jgi:hypothetical protein
VGEETTRNALGVKLVECTGSSQNIYIFDTEIPFLGINQKKVNPKKEKSNKNAYCNTIL